MGGLIWNTWFISDYYLKYPTTTFVLLAKFLNETTAPIAGMRFYNPYYLDYNRSLKDIFRDLNDTTTIIEGRIRRKGFEMNGIQFQLDSFSEHAYYYVSVFPTQHIRYTPEDMYARRSHHMHYTLTSNLLSGKDHYMYLYIHPYDTDFEGLDRTDLPIDCHRFKMKGCIVQMTYSIKTAKLLPPPYDTGCEEYRPRGYTSKENCVSKCLSEFMEKHGLAIQSNVIKRREYENSSLTMAPWYFRTMENDTRQKLELELKKNDSKPAWKTNVTKMLKFLPAYKQHWNDCMNQKCHRPDCFTEAYVPIFFTSAGEGGPAEFVDEISIRLYPPNDAVTIVTSKPKLLLIDLIVYVLSSVSFWFGFSPLRVAFLAFMNNPSKVKEIHMIRRIRRLEENMKIMRYKQEHVTGSWELRKSNGS